MGTASTDWQNEIFSNSVTMDNFISMRGSLFNKIPSFFQSSKFNDDNGLVERHTRISFK